MSEQEDRALSDNRSAVELQIINYVLDNGSMDILKHHNLGVEYFPGYMAEFEFIMDHYAKYRTIPDISTFLIEFPDMDLFEVLEVPEAMVASIKEERAYSLLIPALNKISEEARDNDAVEATKLMKGLASDILKTVNVVRFAEPYDIFKQSGDRAKDYMQRLSMDGLMGCTSGIEPLDLITHGWLDQDFVALTGRIQEGKSFILQYMMLSANLAQKKRVLFLSLENSKLLVGYRADSLLGHFSNDAIMAGKDVLVWKEGRPYQKTEDYLGFLDSLKHSETPFMVMDNSDNNDRPYTPEDIEELIIIHKPDIVAIDQLSLLTPTKKVSSIREGYVDITRYFRQMIGRLKIPIVLACQSGREAAKSAMKNKEAAPELFQIAESDSVGQDATRVVSLRLMDGLLKWSLKKNTYGRSGVEGLLKWDIDHGILTPLVLDPDQPNPDSTF